MPNVGLELITPGLRITFMSFRVNQEPHVYKCLKIIKIKATLLGQGVLENSNIFQTAFQKVRTI